MQGPEEAYALGEEIAKVIWAPVMRSHRVTVEQMALLEPGLSETVCATLLAVMKEAMDEVVARGYPEAAVARIVRLEQANRFKRRLMLIARLSGSAINLDQEIPRD